MLFIILLILGFIIKLNYYSLILGFFIIKLDYYRIGLLFIKLDNNFLDYYQIGLLFITMFYILLFHIIFIIT